jgi:trk system potassium uptake protein TrkA
VYAIVVGAGPTAQELADRLRAGGHQIAFVISNAEAVERMAVRFPTALVIRGTGTDEATLRDAGADECDALFALDDDDSHTMVACLLARERFHVKHVVALATACEDMPAFSALSIMSVCAPEVLAENLLATL